MTGIGKQAISEVAPLGADRHLYALLDDLGKHQINRDGGTLCARVREGESGKGWIVDICLDFPVGSPHYGVEPTVNGGGQVALTEYSQEAVSRALDEAAERAGLRRIDAEVLRISASSGFLYAHVKLPDGSMSHGFVEPGAAEGDTVEWMGLEAHGKAVSPAKVVRKRTGPREGRHEPIKRVSSVTEALAGGGEQVTHGYQVSELDWQSLLPDE